MMTMIPSMQPRGSEASLMVASCCTKRAKKSKTFTLWNSSMIFSKMQKTILILKPSVLEEMSLVDVTSLIETTMI